MNIVSHCRLLRASAFGCAIVTAGLCSAQEASQNKFLSPFKSAGKRMSDSTKSVADRMTGKNQPRASAVGGVPGFGQGDITSDIQPSAFANVQFAMGKSYEDEHDDQQATMAYEAAIRNNPQHWQAFHRLALVKERQGKGNESGQLFAKAVAIKPNELDLLVDFGYWAYLRRDWTLAEKMFRDALAINPSDSRARNNYALMLARSGRSEHAIGQFLAAGLDEQAAHANLAFAQMTEGDVASAKLTLSKSLQLAPTNAITQGLSSTVVRVASASPAMPPNAVPPMELPQMAVPPARRLPVTALQVASQPTASKPVAALRTPSMPAPSTPAPSMPVVSQAATSMPVASMPVNARPATARPATAMPAIAQPVTAQPATSVAMEPFVFDSTPVPTVRRTAPTVSQTAVSQTAVSQNTTVQSPPAVIHSRADSNNPAMPGLANQAQAIRQQPANSMKIDWKTEERKPSHVDEVDSSPRIERGSPKELPPVVGARYTPDGLPPVVAARHTPDPVPLVVEARQKENPVPRWDRARN